MRNEYEFKFEVGQITLQWFKHSYTYCFKMSRDCDKYCVIKIIHPYYINLTQYEDLQ